MEVAIIQTVTDITKELQTIPLKPYKKTPKVKWKDYRYNPDDFQHANTGILTGTKHTLTDLMGYQTDLFLTVVDIDISDQEIQQKIVDILSVRFGDTYTVKTGGNHAGLHLYYLTDEPVKKMLILETPHGNIEILGKNHYVVSAGSTVKKEYIENKPLTMENISRTYKDMLMQVLTSICELTKKTASQKIQSTTPQQKKSVLSKAEEQKTDNANNADMGNTEKKPIKCKQVVGTLEDTKYLFTPMEDGSDVLSHSVLLWKTFLKRQANKIYDNWTFSIDDKILCVFHEEKNPSAGLFKTPDGRYLYHDFHDGNSYTVVEFFKYLETGSAIIQKKDYRYWKTRLMRYINEKGIDTGLADNFDMYVRGLNLSFLLPDQMKVFIKLLEIAREHYNVGQYFFLSSSRYLAKQVIFNEGIPTFHGKINRLMNQLCFLGLLSKGGKYVTDEGVTYKYSIPKADIKQVKERFDLLDANDLLYWRKFKKKTVALLVDQKTASDLFRREPEPIKLTKEDKALIKQLDKDQELWEKEHDYDDLAPEQKEYIYDAETGDIYTYTPELEDIERMNDYPSIDQIDQMVAFYQRE